MSGWSLKGTLSDVGKKMNAVVEVEIKNSPSGWISFVKVFAPTEITIHPNLGLIKSM